MFDIFPLINDPFHSQRKKEREKKNIEYLRYLPIRPRGVREVQIDLNLFSLSADFHIFGPLSDSQCWTYWAKYQT